MAFTFMTRYGFYRDNQVLMELIFNEMERDAAREYFSRGAPPLDETMATKLLAIAEKYGKPLGAAKSSLATSKEKVDQRYRLVRDFDLYSKDSIGYLPISRTEVLRTLCQNGFMNLEQLRIAPDATLLKINGIGPNILKEIRTAIETHDEKIAPRPPQPVVKVRKPRLSGSFITGKRKARQATLAGQGALPFNG